MQTDPVKEIAMRTQRYWYEDGIWEIAYGVISTLLGVFFLLTADLNWSGPFGFVLGIAQMIVLVGMFVSINKMVRFLKERITYPRTGFVMYRRRAPGARLKRLLLAMLVSGATGALIGSLAVMRMTSNHMPLIVGIMMAGSISYIGYRFHLVRLYIVATLTALWGFIVSLFRFGNLPSIGIFFTGFGALILLSGLVTLFIYMRRTHPVTDGMIDPDLLDRPQDEQ